VSVFRKRITKTNFTVVQNELLYDPELDGRTKWLIIYCLSKPDGWDFASERIARETKDGRDAVLASMKAARDAGWMKVYDARQTDGSFCRTTEVTDTPGDFSTDDVDIKDRPKPDSSASVDSTPVETNSADPDSKRVLISPSTEVVSTDKETNTKASSLEKPKEPLPKEPETISVIERTDVGAARCANPTMSDPQPTITPDDSAPPGNSTGRPDAPDVVRRVFDAWVEIMEKNPAKVKLTGERRTKIQARLKSGELDEQDLVDAFHGAKANPWMMGRNDRGTVFDDIVTILKNNESTTRHARNFREGRGQTLGKQSKQDQAADFHKALQEMKEKYANA